MNSVISSASAVQDCLSGVRIFSHGGTREQVVAFGKEEQSVWGAREKGCNSRVWTPAISRLSNRATFAETRPRDSATQLVRAECCRNRSPMASAGVGGLAKEIKFRRGLRPAQSYRDLGIQVFPGLVKDCRSTRLEICLTNGFCKGHPASQVSWSGSKLSRLKHQLFTSLRATTKPGAEDSSELSKSWDVEFDGSKSLVSKVANAPWNSEASCSLGLPRKKLRAFLVRAAILSRSPDTKPDEQHDSDREVDSHISVATTYEAPDSVVSEDIQPVVVHGGGGKSGFASFHRPGSDQQEPETTTATNKSWRTIIWLLGPLMLTTSVFLPPLYLRKIFSRVLSDSLTTDFVILIFTETLFFIGASLFLYIAHEFRSGVGSVSASERRPSMSLPFGYRVSAIVSLGIGLFLPVATFSMVWPWTGPAAAAALAPYMVGLLVQLSLEQIARVKRSPVWPLVPITFQMYRLHQLNRAAQLISGLMFSLKGVEATAETMAISGSLQTLLFVLKILGVVCLWSLGALLTHQLPTQPPASSSIASLP